ncbi:hypothetical protein [Geobacter sp. DSM 9736]|uniref:hypothetical protein n=1 Tax=Geobacter sp. DSM 9736 TaxID=1277350 RepID=UPI000B4FFEB5|nr:hypothetical protein [Geobacter sp. DSM 9736]SNB46904.1 hypothetical protein SAMN06269301_2376 [Geobacter sp. DSM 9736]
MKRISGMLITGAMLITCAGAGAAFGQPGGKGMGRQGGMKDGMMQQMLNEPHPKLAMAYKRNLVNFAGTLKAHIAKTGKVDRQFAESAVEEMKRSLGQMKTHHDEHMKTMSDQMKQQMGEKMKMMDDRIATLQQHLDTLEKEVKAEAPDPKKVTAEVDQILKQCDMMKMDKKSQRKSRTR